MSEPLNAGATPDQLIGATVPLLDDVLGMWLVSAERKRLVRALRDALTGPQGRQIAELVAPYYNPYGDAGDTPVCQEVQGTVEFAGIVPGDGSVMALVGNYPARVTKDTDLRIDGDGASPTDLAHYLVSNACDARLTVEGGETATKAVFTSTQWAR